MKNLCAALLAAIVLSVSAAYGAEGVERERKPVATQTQKQTAQRIERVKKYLADKASKTAAIIRVNAAKLRKTVWPEPYSPAESAREQKGTRKATKERARPND
jgi:hypothetical protein